VDFSSNQEPTVNPSADGSTVATAICSGKIVVYSRSSRPPEISPVGARMNQLQKQHLSEALAVGLMGLMAASIAWSARGPKDKKEDPMAKTFAAPVDRVYAAAVRVASADYTLKSAFKDAYTVNFIFGGKFSLYVSAVCQDRGSGATVVTLAVTQAEGNPQLFFVNKEKQKLAKRFWEQLEAALKSNEKVVAAAPRLAMDSPPRFFSKKPIKSKESVFAPFPVPVNEALKLRLSAKPKFAYFNSPRVRNQLARSVGHAESAASFGAKPTPCWPSSKMCNSAGTWFWRSA